MLCYSAEQLVLGRCCFIGGAVKLFIGEVGAGNEAKSKPWPRRRRKAVPSTERIGPLRCVAWVGFWGVERYPDDRVR